VLAALHQKGYPHFGTLEIGLEHGNVIVEGVLPTYYLRQVAMECIRSVSGVTSVIDRIRVMDEPQVDPPPTVSAAIVQPGRVRSCR